MARLSGRSGGTHFRAFSTRMALRPAALAILILLVSDVSSGIERRRGVIKQVNSTACTNQCSIYRLDADSGYVTTFLKAEPSTYIRLLDYVNAHVEVIGYVARCGGCNTFMVLEVRELSPNEVVDYAGTIPHATALHQNHPNPFNPATSIRFDLAAEGYVSIKVFTLLGREIETLLEGQKTRGTYTVSWDATGWPSGVYVYRLLLRPRLSPGLVESRTMMLLR